MDSKSVEIELTTKCTIECPACPRTYRRKFGDRTWDTGHLDKNVVFKTFESPDFQNIIPTTNWMYPAYKTELPEGFDSLAIPTKSHIFDTELVASKQKKWIDEWLTSSTN